MRFISKLLPASKWKLVGSSIGVLALVVFASMVIFEMTKVEVVVKDNGDEKSVRTHKNTVAELLKELGITISEHDELSHELHEEIETGMEIDYETAKHITVMIDGKSHTYYSTADTVEDFLKEQNLSFTEHDEVSVKNTDLLTDQLEINVKRAFEVVINDGGEEKIVNVTGGTVQELLENNEISLEENDKLKPQLDDQVTKDTSVTIVRVEMKEEEIEEKVAFETETEKDSSLLKGNKKVITEGKDGKSVKTYEVTLENGEETGRELLDEKVSEKSVNKVVAVGTKEPEANLKTLSSDSNGNSSDGKTLTMTASAFTASCSGCSGYTTTGINLKSNPNQKVIAVDPNVIPLGTKVWVEGYGEAIAGDTGSNIKGNRIDIHVPDKSKAYQWGVRKVQVKILD